MTAKWTHNGDREPVRFDRPNLLLTEGFADAMLCQVLIEGIAGSAALEAVHIHVMKGNTSKEWKGIVALALKDEFFSENGAAIGLFSDADHSAASAFDRLCGVLETNQLARPTAPGVVESGTPRVGALVLPGEGESGALEDLLLLAVADPARLAASDAYLGSLSRAPSAVGKARALAYLSGEPELTPSVHIALRAGRGFDLAHESLDGVRGFLRELVSPTG